MYALIVLIPWSDAERWEATGETKNFLGLLFSRNIEKINKNNNNREKLEKKE